MKRFFEIGVCETREDVATALRGLWPMCGVPCLESMDSLSFDADGVSIEVVTNNSELLPFPADVSKICFRGSEGSIRHVNVFDGMVDAQLVKAVFVDLKEIARRKDNR